MAALGTTLGSYVANPAMLETNKTAAYTVTAAENGTLFTTGTGAVTFTLPTIAAGLCYEFLNLVDADMAIASAGSLDNIILFNDASADSATFGTSAKKIGAYCRVRSNSAGDKWYFENLNQGCTVTVA